MILSVFIDIRRSRASGSRIPVHCLELPAATEGTVIYSYGSERGISRHEVVCVKGKLVLSPTMGVPSIAARSAAEQ